MKVIIKDKNYNKTKLTNVDKLIEWLVYVIASSFILLLASNLFRALYIKNFFFGFLSSLIISILNKTLKPILIEISLPLIGMSLGLFYFVINLVILLIVDILLGANFDLNGFFSPFIVSVFISVMNVIIEHVIVKPLIERCKK